MDKSLTKMIRSLSPKFPEWDETFQRFDRQSKDPTERENYDAEVRTIQEVCKILETVLKVCTKVGGYKEDWDFPEKLHLMICGIDTWVESKKMGIQVEIGRYDREIFLQTSVHAPHFLRKMDDEFWAWFLELRTLGNFCFEQNACPKSQEGRNAIEEPGEPGDGTLYRFILSRFDPGLPPDARRNRHRPKVSVPCLFSPSGWRGRPPFRGANRRSVRCSSDAINSAPPSGRPVCVERRRSAISDSVS